MKSLVLFALGIIVILVAAYVLAPRAEASSSISPPSDFEDFVVKKTGRHNPDGFSKGYAFRSYLGVIAESSTEYPTADLAVLLEAKHDFDLDSRQVGQIIEEQMERVCRERVLNQPTENIDASALAAEIQSIQDASKQQADTKYEIVLSKLTAESSAKIKDVKIPDVIANAVDQTVDMVALANAHPEYVKKIYLDACKAAEARREEGHVRGKEQIVEGDGPIRSIFRN